MSRVVLLGTSPRVAPGMLTWDAWQILKQADAVLTGAADHPLLPYATAAGVVVQIVDPEPHAAADRLLNIAGAGTAVWIAESDGDEPLLRALGTRVAAATETGTAMPEIEFLPGSYDLPGAKVLDLVAVMDRLRSPGGCPWDAEQTHASLVKYLLEEAYETVETIEQPGPMDRVALREELGDVLLQVAFHARLAQEHPEDPFGIDDVAEGIAAKLVHRHPHVFGDGDVNAPTAAHVEANWEQIKKAEKGRTSAVDGVPVAQPALTLTAKLLHRADKHGVPVEPPAPEAEPEPTIEAIGEALYALAAYARSVKVDPEEALRRRARALRDEILIIERKSEQNSTRPDS